VFKKIILLLFLIAGFTYYVIFNFFITDHLSFSPKIRKELYQLMENSMKKYDALGMTLGVWIPGRGAYVEGEGISDLVAGSKIKVSDKFRIGSMTKTFTATVILQLVDEGSLSLDDRLNKFEPHISNGKNITVRELLNMTSGLYNYTEIPWVEKKFMQDRFTKWEPEQLVDAAIDYRPYFRPGKGFHYSNTNYVLLGLIIQKVTGNPVGVEFKNRIFDKLKLKKTLFPVTSKIAGPHIHGYMKENGKWVDWTEQNVSWAWTAGAIISNMYDMKKYIKALSDGTFLSPKLQEQRLTDWVEMSKKPQLKSIKYGLGCFTDQGFVGHNGGLPGYVNLAMYNPKDGTIIAFMLNTQPDEGDATLEIFTKVVKILYPAGDLKKP